VSSDAARAPLERGEPGALVLVVGPSGAGKDSLMRLARDRLAGEADIVFARRVVTRPSGPSEDHDTLSLEAFAAARSSGAFCLSWSANDLDYGLPSHLTEDLARGRTVVANGSRAAVPEARRRFPRVVCVLVTAPAEILAARLATRQRTENIDARLVRAATVELGSPADAVIDNVGSPEDGAGRLVGIILAIRSQTPKEQRA
jgi:ribose 1,5-bisphosphokinase